MMAHIKLRYAELGARTVRAIKATEIHFNAVSFSMPCIGDGNALIVWTRDKRVGRIEIRDGRWTVTRAVQIHVCQVQSFCIDGNGDVVVPTADDLLLVLDAVTLQVKRTIAVAAGMDIENICYVSSRQMYLAYGRECSLCLLNLDFELLKFHKLSHCPSNVQVNASGTLVSARYFDHEVFRVLYHLDENLALHQIMDLEECGHGFSKSVTLHDHGAVVHFASVMVGYRYEHAVLQEAWQLSLEKYSSEHDLSYSVFVNPNRIIVGRGKRLLLIAAEIPEIVGVVVLDLTGEIRQLYVDASGEYLIVRGGRIKLVRLHAIPWDGAS